MCEVVHTSSSLKYYFIVRYFSWHQFSRKGFIQLAELLWGKEEKNALYCSESTQEEVGQSYGEKEFTFFECKY